MSGAVEALAPHPSNADIIYIGTVNGGIWKTTNATMIPPHWEHQTDNLASLSIGAIEFDPTDTSYETLVAGIGRTSSFGDFGGTRSGLLKTTNGGATWIAVNGADIFKNLNIAGVAPRGETLVVAVNCATTTATDTCKWTAGTVGIWRITNDGKGWQQVSGAGETGLPQGASSGIESDPLDKKRLYTNVNGRGLYRSFNMGATWEKISSPEIDALLAEADNVKISASRTGSLYTAIDTGGTLKGVFRSPDGGHSWAAMDLPTTTEPGADGKTTQAGIHPGGQGGYNLSFAADPTVNSIVYIGGDRQPAWFVNGKETGTSGLDDDPPLWPNSIGAFTYSGRLFRGDAAKQAGTQWVHITHSAMGVAGAGTSHGTAPHADSRAMRFSADGALLEVDDGGIYKRTDPRTAEGNWVSLIGNLEATEMFSVAWDDNCHLAFGGAQDTGTPGQLTRSGLRWQSISVGDGGVVAVDTVSTPAHSIRYSSSFELRSFQRQVYDLTNADIFDIPVRLELLPKGDKKPSFQWYTPIKLNDVNPLRMIIGGTDSVYESTDQGDTLAEIRPGIQVNGGGANPIAYGAKGNEEILYVGSRDKVFVREAAKPSPLKEATSYSGGQVQGVAIDPDAPLTAFVVSTSRVLRTIDAGRAWEDITGDLHPVAPGIYSVAYSTAYEEGAVVVGTGDGVFISHGPAFSHWERLGAGLPNVPVYHVEYNAADRLYLVGTLGRGAWTLRLPVSGSSAQRSSQAASGSEASSGTTPRPPNSSAAELATLPFGLGIVVDLKRKQIYAAALHGGFNAVDLGSGKRLWSTMEAASPIGLVGDRVVGQAEVTAEAQHALKLVGLNPATGKVMVKGSASLPPEIIPSVGETAVGSFIATAAGSGNYAIVSWQFREPAHRPLQGIVPGTATRLGPSGGNVTSPPSLGLVKNGVFRMDLRTGSVLSLNALVSPPPETPPSVSVAAATAIADLPEKQFLAEDGQHVLVTKRTGDDTTLQKYILAVYDLKSKKRLGEFRSHLSVVPFVVVGSRVIYESGPYAQRSEKGLTERPREIRCVDLTTGKELWTVPVRGAAYRGPLPP